MAPVLWLWTACSRGLFDPQRKIRCVFCRRKHGDSGPVPTTGWGHAQSFLLPPSTILQAFLCRENHNSVSWTGADAVFAHFYHRDSLAPRFSLHTSNTVFLRFLFDFAILGFWCVCCFETGSHCVAPTALELPL